MIRAAARIADRTPIPGAPPYEACVRPGAAGGVALSANAAGPHLTCRAGRPPPGGGGR
ncbi:hypothetical protein ACRAWD_14125 [Caulobacter segnis]